MAIKKKETPGPVIPTTSAMPLGSEPKLNPTQKLRASMSTAAWQILVDLVHWADMWEIIFEGGTPEWSEDVMVNLMRPFIGFGPHPDVWSMCVKMGVGRDVIIETYRWVNDEKFRATVTFRWLIVQEVAPTLAAETKQFSGMKLCHEAMAELETVGYVLDEKEFEGPNIGQTAVSPPRTVPVANGQGVPRRA